MSDNPRTIDVTLESGEQKSAGEVSALFFEALEDLVASKIVEVTAVHGENPEAAPGHLAFETYDDPELMAEAVEWMASATFDNVQATVAPTIENDGRNILEDIESEFESLSE